ncbi:NADH-ubiquinone oxidoreductase-F iron-sulfur binding region domain-containing protein [Rudaeicoccus suwonensis]|uniref:NADH:ubiquinone oxidoreductase subunit F (NADH-binding) n=1 Tax=Rudaeicoccus suwonensis TaxID=657409 RepID=A0A561E0Z0_9MICO|nr:NADH-ubiquinone oxidoreductase-F iron-sulfur binding region domain-containing protein [Rudaeicoccus suwonensis]TWE09257.1 NADH:ubiquinone oxidoreductase subunit F (NADH-binding) [Rudaeicoccus suwonensis]
MSLIDLLDEAGLTGRGGGSFPTGTKVRTALERGASLVVNACDGEIGTSKDASVVAHHLDEICYGASLLTSSVTWAAHRGSPTEAALLAAGLDVLSTPARYVASEESALVNLLNGGLARPLMRQAPVAVGSRTTMGRRLPATLVLNAETVWRIGQIERYGPTWFRSYGTPAEPGPRLVTISGSVERPGVYETAAGVALNDLLVAAGTFDSAAVGLSGLSGGWLSAAESQHITWSNAGLAPYGFRTGSGAIAVLDRSTCPLTYVAELVRFAAGESAGQCGPCMFGVPAVARTLDQLLDGSARPSDIALLDERVRMLVGRGACRFPDGIAGFVTSALRVFDPDITAHLDGGCLCLRQPAHAQR